MNKKEKKAIRTDMAVRGTLKVLHDRKLKHPTKPSLPKRTLFHSAAIYAADYAYDDDLDPGDAVGIPSSKEIENQWREIKLIAADKYREYIVWDEDGVYLGTFEEYEALQDKYIGITKGVVGSLDDNARIIVKQGGVGKSIEVEIKLLEGG